MSKMTKSATAFALGAVLLAGAVPAGAGSPSVETATERPHAVLMPDEFSASRRGRRNTAIALGVAAGLLGLGAVGAYPYHPYGYYGYPRYGYYGYYGPALYPAPVVYVRPRRVRCWVYDPFRGIRYRTYCYR